MYYPDLSAYSYYLKTPVSCVLNAGWLDSKHPFEKGLVSPGFLDKLATALCAEGPLNVHVNKIRGAHHCSVCGDDGPFELGRGRVVLGSSELWIPSIDAGHFWAAPSLIYHYVKDHGYRPPQAFVDSIMALDLAADFDAQGAYLRAVEGHF